MGSTFGAFTTARLGMIASQKWLDVTGHNITNINTPGYTRQRVDQYSFMPSTGFYRSDDTNAVGTGVLISSISQLRDPYLDVRFRKEMASIGSTDSKLSGIEQLQSVLDEVGANIESGVKGAGITDQLFDLAKQIQNYNTSDGAPKEFESLVRSSANSLCKMLQTYAKDLETVKTNIADGYQKDVETVDSILEQIRDLNAQIKRGDVNGDAGLELRDRRNQLIDELSEYIKIDVTYGKEYAGAIYEVEKLNIGLVDPKTNKVIATLIDGDDRAEVTMNSENPLADNDFTINISELMDLNGNQVSGIGSVYQTGSWKMERDDNDNAISNGTTQTFTISYKDAAGTDKSLSVNFTAGETGKKSAQSFLKALEDDTSAAAEEFKSLFDVKGESSIIFSTKDGGTASITGTQMGTNSGIIIGTGKQLESTEPNALNGVGKDYLTLGRLQSSYNMLTCEGEYSVNDGSNPNLDKSIRGVPYYEQALNHFANKFASEMNKLNTMKPDGSAFDDSVNPGVLFEAEDGGQITAANIKIAEDWKSGKTKIVNSLNDNPATPPSLNASESNTNINRFVDMITSKGMDFAPTDLVRSNTAYQSGPLTAKDVQTGDQYVATINYVDADNVPQTIQVPFSITAGDGSDGNVAAHLLTALQNNTDFNDIFTANTVDGDTTGKSGIIFADKNGATGTNLVTSITVSPAAVTAPATPATGTITVGKGETTGDVGGDTIFSGSFVEMFTNIQAILGDDYKNTYAVLETYTDSADEINNSRDSVSGVDLNEEGTNILQYQKSFAAACRLMTALDEVLDKIINGMGVVGR